MVVGTYTDTISEGLYSFRFDQTSGKATSMGLIRLANPSYLTFSSDGYDRVIFTVPSEMRYDLPQILRKGMTKIIKYLKDNNYSL